MLDPSRASLSPSASFRQFPTAPGRFSRPTESCHLRGGVVAFEKDSLASQCHRFLLWMHSIANGFFETDGFI